MHGGDVLEKLKSMIARKGGELYGGEQVTQLQHALQAAALAEAGGAADHVVVAALLHDIGHLFEPEFDRAMELETDLVHERLGEAFLKRFFGADVTEPVRLHVAAKRYLCATDPSYFATLSAASVHSLKLQGGPMSEDEVARFETEPSFRDAVQVRLYDDRAKDPAMVTPAFDHYLDHVKRVLKAA